MSTPFKLMTFTLLQTKPNVNTINFMATKTQTTAQTTPYHHGNLREALFLAAIDILAEKGVSQFSLSELARNLGVTPAAAYKHFAHKEALLAELTRHGFARLQACFERAAPRDKPATNAKEATRRFERIGQAYLAFGREEPALFHLIFGKGTAAMRREISPGGERSPTFAYLAEALEDLQKFGVISQRPGPQEQWFAWSAIHGATELSIASVSSLVKTEQAARVITTLVIKAFR
jgi:AcrR family transcriptional regulator